MWHNTFTITNLTFENVNLEIDFNNDIIIQQDNTIRKYDQNGNLLWQVVNCSGSGQASTFDFTIDPTGNIYIVGTFNGVIDFNPGTATNNQTAQGNSQQIFIQKLNSSGNFVSVYRTFDEYIGGLEPYKPFSAKIFDVKFDSGKVFVLGNTTGSFGIKFTNTSVHYGPFLLSLNNNCSLNYVNRVSVNSLDFLDAKLLSNSNGTLSVFAKLDGSQATAIDFDPGPSQAFISVSATNGRIVKADYNSLSGNFVNVNVIVESWANRILDFSIDKDLFNNFYIAGTFSGTVDFNPDYNISNNLVASYYLSGGGVPIGGSDIFFAKYNSSLTLINANRIGSYGSDSSKDIFIQSYECFITGSFDITFPVDFNFDSNDTFELIAPPRAYGLKLNLCENTFNTITQTANNSFTLNGQTYTQSGTFTQVIPNANGCDSTITLNLIINNSSLDEVINSAISIYPNPASNQITIAYAGQIQKVEIMDAKGAKVYSSNENKKEIMLPSSMQTGYYLVLVHTQEGVFRKELVVNK
jgi:hypothetical protein